MDRDRLDAKFLASTDYPQGNLAAVRNQNFLKHQKTPARDAD